jgi:hypothetical protein
MRTALMLALTFASLVAAAGCDTLGDTSDGGADASGCGSQTCSSTQFCLYRDCSLKDRCKPSATCPPGTTPSDCSGQPGCLVPPSQCAPIVQGCRDVPPSCGGDVRCACESVCGGAAACSQVDGANASCTGS